MPEPYAPSRSPESSIQERERERALVVEQAALKDACEKTMKPNNI